MDRYVLIHYGWLMSVVEMPIPKGISSLSTGEKTEENNSAKKTNW